MPIGEKLKLISNSIQLIQQADSLLTYERIPTADQASACLKPAEYLATVLQENGQIGSTRYFQKLASHLIQTSNQSHLSPVNDKDIVEVIYRLSRPKTIFQLNIVDWN